MGCDEKMENKTTIRSVRVSDAKALMDLARSIVAEDCFQLLTENELMLTLEGEQEWIATYLANPNRLILVAEQNGILVGQLDFCEGNRARTAHIGEFGMSVDKKFRNQGIGCLLVKNLLDWARDHSGIEKINLSVHSTNTRAIGLYKKMGFEVEGIKKKDLKYSDGQYIDTILMARFL